MTTLSLTDVTNGTTADATVISNNNAAIKTVVNGNIDNGNIAASAGIAIDKLSGYPSSATKHLRGDGSWLSGGEALLGSQVLTSTQTSFDTNTILSGNISGSYTHLRVIALLRGTAAATTVGMTLTLNNDSGANYDYVVQYAQGNGTNAATSGIAGTEFNIGNGFAPAANATAGRAAILLFDLPFYALTTFNKQASWVVATTKGTSSADQVHLDYSGTWRNTAAVTRLALAPASDSWAIGCAFYLYGRY